MPRAPARAPGAARPSSGTDLAARGRPDRQAPHEFSANQESMDRPLEGLGEAFYGATGCIRWRTAGTESSSHRSAIPPRPAGGRTSKSGSIVDRSSDYRPDAAHCLLAGKAWSRDSSDMRRYPPIGVAWLPVTVTVTPFAMPALQSTGRDEKRPAAMHILVSCVRQRRRPPLGGQPMCCLAGRGLRG